MEVWFGTTAIFSIIMSCINQFSFHCNKFKFSPQFCPRWIGLVGGWLPRYLTNPINQKCFTKWTSRIHFWKYKSCVLLCLVLKWLIAISIFSSICGRTRKSGRYPVYNGVHYINYSFPELILCMKNISPITSSAYHDHAGSHSLILNIQQEDSITRTIQLQMFSSSISEFVEPNKLWIYVCTTKWMETILYIGIGLKPIQLQQEYIKPIVKGKSDCP